MKTRIKIVTDGFGTSVYFPQAKDHWWNGWKNLKGSRSGYCYMTHDTLKDAQDTIDSFLNYEIRRKQYNNTTITYVKYP